MIYLIGGAPRVGKSTLCQRFASRLAIGWTSTDTLFDMLTFSGEIGKKPEWNADPNAINATADWFFPYLERYIWGISSLSNDYIVEGVWILPKQALQLAHEFPIRSVFLGCTDMSLEKLDRYPGHSKGYSNLPESMRLLISLDVPLWSRYVCEAAEQFGCPYVDTALDFLAQMNKAERILESPQAQL